MGCTKKHSRNIYVTMSGTVPTASSLGRAGVRVRGVVRVRIRVRVGIRKHDLVRVRGVVRVRIRVRVRVRKHDRVRVRVRVRVRQHDREQGVGLDSVMMWPGSGSG